MGVSSGWCGLGVAGCVTKGLRSVFAASSRIHFIINAYYIVWCGVMWDVGWGLSRVEIDNWMFCGCGARREIVLASVT